MRYNIGEEGLTLNFQPYIMFLITIARQVDPYFQTFVRVRALFASAVVHISSLLNKYKFAFTDESMPCVEFFSTWQH